MAPPEKLIGKCIEDISISKSKAIVEFGAKKSYGVCTDGSRYHVHLSLLGKTNISDPDEDRLLGPRRHKLASRAPLSNPVFLFDVGQMFDRNETRGKIFEEDLQSFLGLHHLGEREMSTSSKKKQTHHYVQKLYICQDKYRPLRAELIRNGKAASKWIRKYFLRQPEVVVSSPDYFEELLLSWHLDPCEHE